MGWTLAPHVSFSAGSGRILFLDLARDRYFAVPPAQAETFSHWAASPDGPPLPPVVEQLHRAGLLARTEGPSVIASPRIAPVRSAGELRTGHSRPGAALAVWWSLWRVRDMLRRKGLLATLDWLRPSPEQDPPERLRAQAHAFLRVRRPLPDRRSCLADSLALVHFLRHRGGRASIVFGVTATPFNAHCWVQSGDEVLNDALDHVAPFAPILQR
ncbi:MAG TPA: lasso peptide biosynthesis B2 protein [Sphingomonas sp.]|nr:lasso peptide biosynthesis B2 protein [Sphingomonas sp.]